MGGKRDKGMALARYLVGHAGIPGLAWNHSLSQVDAPFPYIVVVETQRNLDPWHAMLRTDGPADRLKMSILYHYGMDSLDQAWVGMQLKPFTTLLTTHYDTIRHRGEHA